MTPAAQLTGLTVFSLLRNPASIHLSGDMSRTLVHELQFPARFDRRLPLSSQAKVPAITEGL